MLSAHERFWAKVDLNGPVVCPGEQPCWTWQAGTFWTGYGNFRYQGKGRAAHRVAYEWLVGPVPEGLILDHLCRNRACVNPAHLEPVTQRENILRGVGTAAVNARKIECKRGHDLMDPSNLKPNSRGARQCRKCSNIARHDRYVRLGR